MHYLKLLSVGLGIFCLSYNTMSAEAALAPPPAVNLKSPNVMVSFGDSITAGAFANTSANLPVSFLPSVLNLANLGDLFKQNILQTAVENKQFWSWSSGLAISSHYNRLKNYYKGSQVRDIQMVNMAVSGSIASDVLLQVKKFSEAMAKSPSTQVTYATVMIGANDLCNQKDMNVSATNLSAAFDELSKIPQVGKMKILVSSIPQIYLLGQPAIKNHVTGTFFLTCEKLRSDLMKSCNRLTHWTSDADYLNKISEVDNTNFTLESVVKEAALKHPNLDIRFSTALSKQSISFGNLAADCFHPNIKGQQQLSEILWNDQPWFK